MRECSQKIFKRGHSEKLTLSFSGAQEARLTLNWRVYHSSRPVWDFSSNLCNTKLVLLFPLSFSFPIFHPTPKVRQIAWHFTEHDKKAVIEVRLARGWKKTVLGGDFLTDNCSYFLEFHLSPWFQAITFPTDGCGPPKRNLELDRLTFRPPQTSFQKKLAFDYGSIIRVLAKAAIANE